MNALTEPYHVREGNRTTFARSEVGATLIGALVALAIIGITVPAFLGALSTSSKTTLVARDQTNANTIAMAHVEFVLGQTYSAGAWDYTITSAQRTSTQQPSWWDASNPPLLDSTYANYRIEATAEDFDADGDSTLEVPGDDDGIRKITIKVYADDPDPLLTLEAHKADI